MANVTTYNPKKVTCSLGRHIASGFADDSFITVEPMGDGTSMVVGCDGEIVRSIDPSDAYTFKLSLLQTSPTNKYLQKMYDKDKKDGTGMFPVTVKDILGNDQFTAEKAWVTKPASYVKGKTQNNREWEIAVAEGNYNL